MRSRMFVVAKSANEAVIGYSLNEINFIWPMHENQAKNDPCKGAAILAIAEKRPQAMTISNPWHTDSSLALPLALGTNFRRVLLF